MASDLKHECRPSSMPVEEILREKVLKRFGIQIS
jgi:hypothetical protein